MPDKRKFTRRDSFRAALLPLAAAGIAASAGALSAQDRGRSLVVFLSRSGNTRVLAGALSRRFGAERVELRPREPWPDDYEEMVAWATRMRAQEGALPLAEPLPAMESYRTVFLGFPIWGMDLPAVTASFLRGHDLAGKTVVPFVTHGGYGTGDALQTAQALAPNARFRDPFVLRCDQERDTLRRLDEWLGEAAIPL